MGYAVADVTVVLSPRAEGTGRTKNCCGNYSAQGHLYFMEKLNHKKGEDQRFRLRYRKTPLAKIVRPPSKSVLAQKSKAEKAKASKTKSKATVKA